MQIRPVEAEYFHADRRTDGRRDGVVVAFRNYENAPKITIGAL
jgi:hypothetical protein